MSLKPVQPFLSRGLLASPSSWRATTTTGMPKIRAASSFAEVASPPLFW